MKLKKLQKIAQSREGVDKLKDLCEQKIHTHLSTPQKGHGNGQDFIMCMGKEFRLRALLKEEEIHFK